MCLISEEYVPCLRLTCRELWEGRFLGYILGMQESNIEDILNKRGMFKSHWEIQEKCLLDSVLYLPNLKFHPPPSYRLEHHVCTPNNAATTYTKKRLLSFVSKGN